MFLLIRDASLFSNARLKCLLFVVVHKLDETLMERLWGLTEMFPETMRTAAEVSAHCSVSLIKKFYRYVPPRLLLFISNCTNVFVKRPQ